MKRHVPAMVKDEVLIKKRREQMVKAAVQLFHEKGFHRTTTREIAKASGLASAHFTNTSDRKKTSSISCATLCMME